MTSTALQLVIGGQPDAVEVPTKKRRKKAAGSGHEGPSIQNYGTPWPIVRAVEREMGRPFALDVCAEPWSAKAEKFYALPQNALVEPWFGPAWMNPIYADQETWLARAAYWGSQGVVVACLVLASTSAQYWRPTCFERGTVDFYEGRIAFLDPATGEPQHGFSMASALVLYGPGYPTGVVRVRSAETGEVIRRLDRGVTQDLFAAPSKP